MHEYFESVRIPWGRAGAERFQREAANGRLVELEAGHHFFISHEDLVVEEMRRFFAGAPE